MPDSLVCPSCSVSLGRDDFPAHQRDCRGERPRLPVAGWLIRREGDRICVITLGPGIFGTLLIVGTELVAASFAETDEAGVVTWLLRELGER